IQRGLLAVVLLPLLADTLPTRGEEQPAPAQPPREDKGRGGTSSLEAMLQTALKNNPDIRMAEAKLRVAEANLNRVRLQVTQRVTTYYHEVEMKRQAVEEAFQRYKTAERQFAAKRIPLDDVRGA